MAARFDKSRLPSRHSTKGPERAPQRALMYGAGVPPGGVELTEAELDARRKAWVPRPANAGSGALWRYAQIVGDAAHGATTHPGARAEGKPYAEI